MLRCCRPARIDEDVGVDEIGSATVVTIHIVSTERHAAIPRHFVSRHIGEPEFLWRLASREADRDLVLSRWHGRRGGATYAAVLTNPNAGSDLAHAKSRSDVRTAQLCNIGSVIAITLRDAGISRGRRIIPPLPPPRLPPPLPSWRWRPRRTARGYGARSRPPPADDRAGTAWRSRDPDRCAGCRS